MIWTKSQKNVKGIGLAKNQETKIIQRKHAIKLLRYFVVDYTHPRTYLCSY